MIDVGLNAIHSFLICISVRLSYISQNAFQQFTFAKAIFHLLCADVVIYMQCMEIMSIESESSITPLWIVGESYVRIPGNS